MSFSKRKIRFDRFTESLEEQEDDHDDHDQQAAEQQDQQQQQQRSHQPEKNSFTSVSLSSSSSTHPNNNNNNLVNIITLINKTRLIVAIITLFLILFGFVILVAFIVRCDEDKLIRHHQTTQQSPNFHGTTTTIDYEEKFRAHKIQWVAGKEFNENTMEPAGNELYGHGNLLLYVARAEHLDGVVVGKYCPHLLQMFIGYQGREIIKSKFELLTFPAGTLSWIPTSATSNTSTHFVGHMVFGGEAPVSEEDTYICRGFKNGHLFLGKFLFSANTCQVAYRAKEFPIAEFEILAVNSMGQMIGVNS